MAYDPLAPYVPLGSPFTPDHIAHIDAGITGAEASARVYVDQVAAQIQVGQVTDPAFDAAVARAITDGRLPTGGGPAPAAPVNVTEIHPGVYEITGLQVTETAPGVYEIGA